MSIEYSMIRAEDKQVVVHSSAIQITNKVSLLQRKAWLFLLYNAYPVLTKERIFSIPLYQLEKELSFTSKNRRYLEEALIGLMATVVEWNIFKKDKETRWKASTLLSSVDIHEGICSYEFSEMLSKELYHPRVFVKVCLALQNNFKSKHAHALYLLLLDYSYKDKAVFKIKDLRAYLAIEDNEYTETKHFLYLIIKKAVNEINKVSNMHVSFNTIKQGRTITSIEFEINIDKDSIPKLPDAGENLYHDLTPIEHENSLPIKLSEIKNKTLKGFISGNNVSLTVLSGLKPKVINSDSIPDDSFEDYLLHLAEYCEKQQGINNIPGLFIKLIKSGELVNNFQSNLKEKHVKEEEKLNKIQEKYNQKVKIIYDQKEINQATKFLKTNEKIFYNLIEKNKDNAFISMMMNKHGLNIQLLNIAGMVPILLDQVQKLEKYKTISFEEWREQWENATENKEEVEKLKRQAKTEVEREL